jgi:WD40 repeat protein/uncharacterized protein YjbI with pentapeptide repeats
VRALPPLSVQRVLRLLEPELGATLKQRLQALAGLIQADGRIQLSAALSALFPAKPTPDALTAFRQFRQALSAAAGDAGHHFELTSDGATRTPPEQRYCWFEGDDGHTESVEQFSRSVVTETRRSQQDAVPLYADAPRRYFVSYAHKDEKKVKALLELLTPQLKIALGYRFSDWNDNMILPGEAWRSEIQDAIRDCDFGLLLLSPEFLASPFITEHELPHFIPDAQSAKFDTKYPIPVGLYNVLAGHIDLKGIGAHQIFRLREKSFGELRTEQDKRAFAEQLAARIVEVAQKHLRPVEPTYPIVKDVASARSRPEAKRFDTSLRSQYACWPDFNAEGFVPTQGQITSMDKLGEPSEGSAEAVRSDAIDYLLEWLADADQPPYCALLGEYGMGKTTTCKALTLRLLDERDAGGQWPLPVYIDLRLIGEAAKNEPLLKDILTRALEREWQAGDIDAGLTADEIIRLVQQEGGLIIFDGLDEVLVHLSEAAGQRFTRELFRILPPRKATATKAGDSKRPGRMLLTCRTHYFRTLRDQKSHFALEDRDKVESGHYRAFVLLPFTEAQIETYLHNALPDEDPQRVLDTIRAVHNLSEMAERPYTLSLISRHFAQIERWRAEGRSVTGLMLYRHMVQSWLERDTGKHQLTPDHKQALMEHFAAELTRSGQRSWRIAQVEQWLVDYLRQRPEIAEHYHGKDRGLLKEDLRTATFLVRVGEDEFRFAHSSLQEYFLAAYLHRALIENRPGDWALTGVSDETLNFVGQWLQDEAATRDTALCTLASLRDDASQAVATQLAFRYFLHASKTCLPNISGRGFQLAGLVWRGGGIDWSAHDTPLMLDGIKLPGAALQQSVWRNVSLAAADFSGASLVAAEFHDCRMPRSNWQETDLAGTVFRRTQLDGGDFEQALFHRTRWQASSHQDVGSPAHWPALMISNAEQSATIETKPSTRLHSLIGHQSGLTCCAFSPNGQQVLSASEDCTLKLWDARSGECLITFTEHQDSVTCCAFSLNGQHMLSASEDCTLKLWDAGTGDCLITFIGHQDSVTSCAFSPDGKRVLSASKDCSLKLWDADIGTCQLTLSGHQNWINCCAFSPDGALLLSASHDKTLKLWNATSGDCLLTFGVDTGHIISCSFSPDGQRLLSGSIDNSLRIWDANSGVCLMNLSGHTNAVTSCTFSPNGQFILSASDDCTLKIWDATNGNSLLTLRGHQNCVTSCAFSPDGQTIVSSGFSCELKLWDTAKGECRLTADNNSGWMLSCGFSPDGKHLFSTSIFSSIKLWNATSGVRLGSLGRPNAWVTSCTFSPNGKLLLATSGDNTLQLWEVDDAVCVLSLAGHQDMVTSCAFSHDCRRLLSASEDSTVKLWDASNGECLLTLKGHKQTVTSCAFSPDGQTLLSASYDETLKLWDTNNGACIHTLFGHTQTVTSCAFSPNGQQLLSGSWDKTLKLWDVTSGKCLLTLCGHRGLINSCSFSPDGQRLLSASDDNTIRLWDSTNGAPLLTIRGHQSWVNCCAFSPDGQRLLSISNDCTLRQWDANTGIEIGPRIHDFGGKTWFVTDAKAEKLLAAEGEAWRYMGWRIQDEAGHYDTVPLEYFGPIPGLR